MRRALVLGGLWVLSIVITAWAQTPPTGQLTLNQASKFRAVTKSDTATIPPTRGLQIGDATACNLSIVGAQDTAAVTISNVQSGQILPFSVTQVKAATTCSTVVALY
jgi:hypothetical protein